MFNISRVLFEISVSFAVSSVQRLPDIGSALRFWLRVFMLWFSSQPASQPASQLASQSVVDVVVVYVARRRPFVVQQKSLV